MRQHGEGAEWWTLVVRGREKERPTWLCLHVPSNITKHDDIHARTNDVINLLSPSTPLVCFTVILPVPSFLFDGIPLASFELSAWQSLFSLKSRSWVVH
jgi:hypothetical protein